MYKQGLAGVCEGVGGSKGKRVYLGASAKYLRGNESEFSLEKGTGNQQMWRQGSIVPSCGGLVKDDIIRPVVYLRFVGIGS